MTPSIGKLVKFNLSIIFGLALTLLSQHGYSQQGGLSMGDVINGAVQTKEMSRQRDSGITFPTNNGVTEIDVNAYPDPMGSSPSTPRSTGSQCSVVKNGSTDLFGQASNNYVCMCGLEIVSMSRCQ